MTVSELRFFMNMYHEKWLKELNQVKLIKSILQSDKSEDKKLRLIKDLMD